MKTGNKLLFSTLLSLLCWTTAEAQIQPYGMELDTIKEIVVTTEGLLQDLNQMMLDRDTNLAFEDYFLLYYGSAYLDGYSPYGEQGLKSTVYDAFDKNEYEEAVEICREIIREHPGNIRAYLNLVIAYENLNDTLLAEQYYDQYANLLSIPFFSGTGVSTDSAFIVRSVDDEYLILGEMGLELKAQQLIFDDQGIPYDRMVIATEEGEEELAFYFNIYQPYLLGLAKMFSDEGEDKGKKSKKRKKAKKKKKKKSKE